jgi:hypothetical protein
MNIKTNWARMIALTFFAFWLVILYVGADHPPPPGFILVVLVDLGSSIVVYYRVKTYFTWVISKKKGSSLRAFGEGLAAGALIALLLLFIPTSREANLPEPGLLENFIWISVLAVVGVGNSMILFGIAALLAKRNASFQ